MPRCYLVAEYYPKKSKDPMMRALPYLSQHIALKNIDKYSSYENIVDNTDETY